MKITFSKIIESKYLFYTIFIFNIIFVCITKYYPSMDGPSHIYNSKLLLQYISGDNTTHTFFTLNKLYFPNWTSSYVLLLPRLFLPGWISEKIFLILYISGMAFSFKYLISYLNPSNSSISIIIFPFIYSFLFHLGFYNFCFSFIFYFWSLGFWLRNQNSTSFFKNIFLFILITFSYLSNLLIFCFLLLSIACYILYFSYLEYIENKNLATTLKKLFKKSLLILMLSLPSIVFLFFFFKKINFIPSNEIVPVKQLIKWLFDGKAFISYDYEGESIIVSQFIRILLIFITISFFFKSNIKNNIRFDNSDVLFFPLLFSFILYLITPNGSSAGMMSERYCLIFSMFFLTWITARSIYVKYNSFLIFIILILHIGLLFKDLNGTIKELNSDAKSINSTEKFIKENSVVLTFNFSDNWLENHFSNYLGVEKPMIILENYEVGTGWFPLKWNQEAIPNITLCGHNSLKNQEWVNNQNSKSKLEIETIFIYGNFDKINLPQWNDLKLILDNSFILSYHPLNSSIYLFKHK